jgi:hypothetical protein
VALYTSIGNVGTTSAGTIGTGTLPLAPPPGSIVVIFITQGGNGTGAVSCSGFSAIPTLSVLSLPTTHQSWGNALYKVAGASEPTSYTVTLNAANFATTQTYVFTGRNTTSPFTASLGTVDGAAGTSPFSIALGGVTAAAGDDVLWVSGLSNQSTYNGPSFTVPTGFTNSLTSTSTTSFTTGVVGAVKANVVAGATGTLTGTFSWTGGGSNSWGGYVISIAGTGTVLGNDGSNFVTPVNVVQFNTTGNAISSSGTPFYVANNTAALTAWINVGSAGTSNTAKVVVYDSGGARVAISAAINVSTTGLKSGAISAALTAGNTYSLVVVPDTGTFGTISDSGSNAFVDKQWTAGHFPYSAPPATLPAVDASVGQAFIVYLTGAGNAYNLSCATVSHSFTIEAVTLNASSIHNYVMPASAVMFDRILGISNDDQILLVSAVSFNLSIGSVTFGPASNGFQIPAVTFSSSVGIAQFSYVPGNITIVSGGVPCSYDFSSYPAFRTAVQQLIDGDDASTSSLSVSILDLIVSLGERRVYRDVRSSTQDVALTLTVTGNSAPLPIDLIELRSVFFPTGITLDYMPYEQFQMNVQRQGQTARKPNNYSYEGENLVFWPVQPDGTVINGRYIKRFCSIVTEGLVGNAFFQRFPDLWLYACLLEAAPYVGEIARMPEWEKRYLMLVEDAKEYELRRFTRGSKLQTRLQ